MGFNLGFTKVSHTMELRTDWRGTYCVKQCLDVSRILVNTVNDVAKLQLLSFIDQRIADERELAQRAAIGVGIFKE